MNEPTPSSTQLVARFNGVQAVVVGDAMLDTYIDGAVSRICKEGPVPVIDWTSECSMPGGAANVAANLAALGARVQLVGLIGDDRAGAGLRNELRALGVETAGLIDDPECATLCKTRLSARGQYLVRLDAGSTSQCSERGRHRLRQAIDAMSDDCDLVVVSDYAYGAIDDRTIDQLSTLRMTRPFVLAIDAKHPMRYAGARATVLTPSLAEACEAIGMSLAVERVPPMDQAIGVTRALRERVDADYLAVTLAGDGVLLVDRNGQLSHVPSRLVSAAQDIGAGDTFISALGLALAAGAAPPQAIEIGIEAALLAVTEERTAVVDQQELLRRVNLAGLGSGPEDASMASSIASSLDSARIRGKTIVFTNGVFDILHVGHIELLRRAKALGDLLVVGINSDASVRRLKGPSRPITSERDRLALVSALESVDFAVLFDEDTPEQLIRTFRPDVHVKGGDYRPGDLPEASAVAEVGGRTVILPFIEGRSTTRLIESIRISHPADLVGVSA
jgi:D-beta-D-heptose 7-phosphate kinase/D-beta-D-heptose 1-phosphate adenosyltransferase